MSTPLTIWRKPFMRNITSAVLDQNSTLSQGSTGIESEKIPGLENITEEDVVLGLYSGFMKYKNENQLFDFTQRPHLEKKVSFMIRQNSNLKKSIFVNLKP